MTLQNLLLQNRAAIVDRWYQLILDSYPPETAKFLRQEADRFQNPVGQTIAPAVDQIFAALLEGGDEKGLAAPLDRVIRIRAVQDFTASEAVAFVFDLKRIIRNELKGELANGMQAEMRDLELRIDRAGLLAFDVYMKCREQLYEIKADQIRNRTAAILRRHNYVVSDAMPEPDTDLDR
jgi:hypothetical protein